MEINLIVTITKRNDTEQFIEFFKKYGCCAILGGVANGTASKNLLSVLGLESTEKVVIFTFAGQELTRKLMRRLSSEMKIDMPDRGVSISIPLASAGGYTATEILPDASADKNTKLRENYQMESKYELIITVCSGGNTDIVMDAARAAGAAGGTVIHAKGTAASAKKFFGLTIAEEKEMVFIVSSTKNKKDIMRSIIQNAGSNTEANSLVFSLPVNDTAGFKLMDDDSEDE